MINCCGSQSRKDSSCANSNRSFALSCWLACGLRLLTQTVGNKQALLPRNRGRARRNYSVLEQSLVALTAQAARQTSLAAGRSPESVTVTATLARRRPNPLVPVLSLVTPMGRQAKRTSSEAARSRENGTARATVAAERLKRLVPARSLDDPIARQVRPTGSVTALSQERRRDDHRLAPDTRSEVKFKIGPIDSQEAALSKHGQQALLLRR